MAHNAKRIACGFSLIELMVTVAVAGILATVAAPAMTDFIDRRRITGAADAVREQLQLARSEAIKQSIDVRVNAATGTAAWCIGFTTKADNCDCSVAEVTDATAATACTITMDGTPLLMRATGSDYSDTSLAAPTYANFVINSRRGMPEQTDGQRLANAQQLTLTSGKGRDISVRMSASGRVTTCSDDVGGYGSCN